MTTKQELFEKCMVFQSGMLIFATHLKPGYTDIDPVLFRRGIRLERQLEACPDRHFTRACNFVARQLGLWEER